MLSIEYRHCCQAITANLSWRTGGIGASLRPNLHVASSEGLDKGNVVHVTIHQRHVGLVLGVRHWRRGVLLEWRRVSGKLAPEGVVGDAVRSHLNGVGVVQCEMP